MGISAICCETAMIGCVWEKKQGVTDKRIGYTFTICTYLKKVSI